MRRHPSTEKSLVRIALRAADAKGSVKNMKIYGQDGLGLHDLIDRWMTRVMGPASEPEHSL